ncbi:MAG: hypothetical protein K9L17_08445 [Clostridiales bacterium]|nr:hypothetical protein [Clostridiales bacterium]MCF8022704.1 hypothetical protein [Clostridiales bacterium]
MIKEIKKSMCETEESKKEYIRARAERTLRELYEILEREDDVSEWLYEELEKIYTREEAS